MKKKITYRIHTCDPARSLVGHWVTAQHEHSEFLVHRTRDVLGSHLVDCPEYPLILQNPYTGTLD